MAPKPIRLLVEGEFITDEERELVIQISRLTSRPVVFEVREEPWWKRWFR